MNEYDFMEHHGGKKLFGLRFSTIMELGKSVTGNMVVIGNTLYRFDKRGHCFHVSIHNIFYRLF